jgi:hypothetical protein
VSLGVSCHALLLLLLGFWLQMRAWLLLLLQGCWGAVHPGT